MRKINIRRLDPYLQDDPKFKCSVTTCRNGREWKIEDSYYCSLHGLEVIAWMTSQKEDDK